MCNRYRTAKKLNKIINNKKKLAEHLTEGLQPLKV